MHFFARLIFKEMEFLFGKKQLFADDLVNMNSDGSKRFKISENVSQHDFVLMIKQYPCLYDESFLGKKDLETQQLKRHAWQEIANLTEHTGKFPQILQLLCIHFE